MKSSRPTMNRTLAGGLLAIALAGAVPTLGSERAIGFQGLEIYRFKDGTRQLHLTDLNGDGTDDILFINNRQSRIEILVRRKEESKNPGDDDLARRFENRGMILDQQISAFAVGDLSGDGRPDLLTFGAALGLRLHVQTDAGGFASPVALYVNDPSDVVSVEVADLNGDSRSDIVLGRRDKATILWNDTTDPFLRQDNLAFADDSGCGTDLLDFQKDGRQDLLLMFNQGIPFRLRLNEGHGKFGIETPLPLPPMRHLYAYTDPQAGPRIGGILRDGVNFRVYELSGEKLEDLFSAQEITPSRVPLPGSGLKHNGAWLIRDVNGDGYDDVVMSLPDRSQLGLFSGGPMGLSAQPETFDTLSEVSALSATRDGDLLVISRREHVAALHLHEALAKFPTLLHAPGAILAGAMLPTEPLHGFFIYRDETNKIALAEITAPDQPMTSFPLDLQLEPDSMSLLDWGADGIGLLLYMPHSGPLLYRFRDGKAEKMDAATFRAILQPLQPDNLTPLNTPSGCERLVAETQSARFYRWTSDQVMDIVRQLNPGQSQAQIVSACPFQGRDGRRGYFAYDAAASDLVWFEGESADPVRLHVKHASTDISAVRQLRNPDRDVLLLIGRRDLLQVVCGAEILTPHSKAEYTSAADDPGLRYFRPVSLGAPLRPMLALVDASNRTVELVSEGSDGLKRELAFEVYQDSGFSRQNRRADTVEPHDLASGDINGDGVGDLIFLIHDNLLIYPGARPAAPETAPDQKSETP